MAHVMCREICSSKDHLCDEEADDTSKSRSLQRNRFWTRYWLIADGFIKQSRLVNALCFGLLATLIIFFAAFVNYPSSNNSFTQTDPMCEPYDTIKCANGGLLEQTENGFMCKCMSGYYGEYCTNASFWAKMSSMFNSDNADVRKGKPGMWWSFLPLTTTFQLKTVYEFHRHQLLRLEELSDFSDNREVIGLNATRILPPARPLLCHPDKRLPPLNMLYKDIVQRDPGTAIKPDPEGRNLLFQAFYQYYMLQFFNNDFNMTVTASQLYGVDQATGRELRSFIGGKLKSVVHPNGEYFAPYLSSGTGSNIQNLLKNNYDRSNWFNRVPRFSNLPEWVTGHPWSTRNPLLFVASTIWVREHNRVCDMLMGEWPSWTDDEIYNTARNIVTGEMMAIMMNEIIGVHTGQRYPMEFKPEIFPHRPENFSDWKTPLEMFLITAWSSGFPEQLTSVPDGSAAYTREKSRGSIDNMVRYMVDEKMNMVVHNNDGAVTEPLTTFMMQLARENKVRSFNDYRRHMGLNPYKSFLELTGDPETAQKFSNLYEDVDDVELLTGMLTEKISKGIVSTVSVLTDMFVVNSIMSSPLVGFDSWTPDTFGGYNNFEMVKSANINKLICDNLIDGCNGLRIKLYAK